MIDKFGDSIYMMSEPLYTFVCLDCKYCVENPLIGELCDDMDTAHCTKKNIPINVTADACDDFKEG